MREELMKEALCWELDSKVTAEYAYGEKDLLYFCPIEDCLEPVHPAQRTNVYFRAPNRHKEGCPNEAPTSEQSPVPGGQKIKPLAEPVILIPTHLGPGLPVKRKQNRPSTDDLRKLARALTTAKPYHPGTFEEVVSAWSKMAVSERKANHLNIEGVDMTYYEAFIVFNREMNDLAAVPWLSSIIYGDARVTEFNGQNGKGYYLVTSTKKFNNLPIRVVVNKRSVFPANIPSLVGKDCTLFLHGSTPELDSVRRATYRIEAAPSQAYKGVVVLERAQIDKA